MTTDTKSANDTDSTPPDMDEVIQVRLLGRKTEFVKRRNIIGRCHNLTHPGALTKKLMDAHGCIQKQCPFFKKSDETPYWRKLERKREQKALDKKNRKLEKAEAKAGLEDLKSTFQWYFDILGHPVRIIRIEKVKPNVPRVFYVSECDFADGKLYQDFYETVQMYHPAYRVLLRHIKDIDGHFVTLEEYKRRFG